MPSEALPRACARDADLLRGFALLVISWSLVSRFLLRFHPLGYIGQTRPARREALRNRPFVT